MKTQLKKEEEYLESLKRWKEDAIRLGCEQREIDVISKMINTQYEKVDFYYNEYAFEEGWDEE